MVLMACWAFIRAWEEENQIRIQRSLVLSSKRSMWQVML